MLERANVWVPGLVLGAVLAFVIRPLLVGLCLLPAGLARNERAFVLFAGLKGAVPILLGVYLLAAHVAGATRLYGIVVVVVIFSVVVQGSAVPTAAKLLRLPMHVAPLEPWTHGVRLRHRPQGVHRFVVGTGSAAQGRAADDLPGGVWVSSVVRNGHLLGIRSDLALRAGDEVLVYADPDRDAELRAAFEEPVSGPGSPGPEEAG